MGQKFPSPAGWSPPGAQFTSGSATSRSVTGVAAGLVMMPIGIALAANGGLDIRYWVIVGAVTDRFAASVQIIVGSLLLMLVAVLAAYSPLGTMVASLVWGVFPGVLHLLFPDDTFRLIGDLPLISSEMTVALHAWVTYGFALISGVMLLGAGIVGALLRR
ncbi:hypothetical protein [Nocardia sp. CC227C]|uniref:hypothetical protein n=1 Tax=Nocardia sp. CC227C TaxID=3044562 RepID=UPI00278BFDFA|nr:hypothetical protein [Nocardia sp. CC227C]